MKPSVVFFVLGALIVLGLYVEYRVWAECRASHSFIYCFRTLS